MESAFDKAAICCEIAEREEREGVPAAQSAKMRLSFRHLPFTVQPQHERDERSDSRFGRKASHPDGGFSRRQHGGADALPLGRSFLGRPTGQGSDRRRRPGWEPDDYCPGSNTDARGWDDRPHLAGCGPEGSAAGGAGLQSVLCYVDPDRGRAGRSRISSAHAVL